MSAKFYFGTRLNPQWVPMFAVGPDFSRTGYSSETAYLNGGASVRNSVASHQVFNMVWNPTKSRDDLRPIADYASGMYDTSDGTELIYFIDPIAADKNVAPQQWAFPAQGARDAPPLTNGPRPKSTPTPSNTLGFPTRSALYTLDGATVKRTLYIPIPPGYVAWVGAVGSATSTAGIQVTPYTAAIAGTPVILSLLDVTDPQRFNASFTSGMYTGIEIRLRGSGTVTFTGLMIQILREGRVPAAGRFISGQGHSGCEFVGKPLATPYMVGETEEAVGMTAKLVERGDWI